VTGRRERLGDVAITAGFVAAGQLGLHAGQATGYLGTAPAGVTAAVVAATSVPLLWRRRWPLGVLVAVAATLVLPRALTQVALPLWGGFGPLVFALYSAGHWAARPKDALALLVPAATLAVLGMELPGFATYGQYAFSVPVLLLGWAVGQGMRRWRRLTLMLRGALDELAATEQVRAAAAVADERARMARELHDVVAHSVSVMVVQAGSARLGMAEDPAASAAALRAVERTGRQALVEMQHLLGLLRPDDAGPSLAPQPTLRALPALVESACAAGQPVELRVEGAPAALPPGLDLSAYRIVQEALTNAVRHAGPVPVTARVHHAADRLELEVTNAPGRPPAARPTPGKGHGLIGMRERAELFGGTLQAGRTQEGGFRVRAVLPLPEPAPQPSSAPAAIRRVGTVSA
jgi:signal transduction histidine kinase